MMSGGKQKIVTFLMVRPLDEIDSDIFLLSK